MADNISVVKLNNENYPMWKFKVKMMLMKDDLWCVITEAPPTVDKDLLAWIKKDNRASAIIGLSVKDSQVNLIKNAMLAKEAWEALKGYHEKATLTTEVMLLKQLCQLCLSYYEDQTMEEHLVKMDNLMKKIAASGQEWPERIKLAMMLCSSWIPTVP